MCSRLRMRHCASNLLEKFTRRKVVRKDETDTQLSRVLSTVDLTLLGIGSTLGIGIYVLAGSVAKNAAGPAVVISFFVAAFASVLAGLCYAEFGARVPKAGSAYVYSYVCVGELVAFIVGWNLIMEYVIGVASVARGYSGYVDSLSGNNMSKAFNTTFHIEVEHLSEYVDFFALAITLVLTVILAFGVKESSIFNNIFTGLNLIVVVFVIIAGSVYSNVQNWNLNETDFNRTCCANRTWTSEIKVKEYGNGGFAPFGFTGIMKGAATCFYGFVGFDCIATTGEEAKNPQKSIPLAIIFSLLFIFLAYFGISGVITMMVPYYNQDPFAPLPNAFSQVDFTFGKWVVTLGAIFGLSTSLLGAMFPMPRVIYAMASDGVLFKFLAKIHHKFQTPLIATIIGGTLGGIMAALFDLESLIDMMSIGTLTAYTLVAVCVLCLRYRTDVDGADDLSTATVDNDTMTFQNLVLQIFNLKKSTVPTRVSSSFTNWIVLVYMIQCIIFCAVATACSDKMLSGNIPVILVLVFFALLMIGTVSTLLFQPVSRVKLTFKVPLVPLIPAASILINIYLIMQLTTPTWARFGIWMLLGFLIYAYCLISGTTDKSYELHSSRRGGDDPDCNKRKQSKVSVGGIPHVLHAELQNGTSEKTISNGASKTNGVDPNFVINLNGTLSGAKLASQKNSGNVNNADIEKQTIQEEPINIVNNEKIEIEQEKIHQEASKSLNTLSQMAKETVNSVITLAEIHVADNTLERNSILLDSSDDKRNSNNTATMSFSTEDSGSSDNEKKTEDIAKETFHDDGGNAFYSSLSSDAPAQNINEDRECQEHVDVEIVDPLSTPVYQGINDVKVSKSEMDAKEVEDVICRVSCAFDEALGNNSSESSSNDIADDDDSDSGVDDQASDTLNSSTLSTSSNLEKEMDDADIDSGKDEKESDNNKNIEKKGQIETAIADCGGENNQDNNLVSMAKEQGKTL